MSEGPPPTPPQQGLPTATQPFPGSLTPGWNDPPPIPYNTQTVGTPGRTKLNKRVPFPLQQGLPSMTKPTAIVQPCQATTTVGVPIASGNIAVVHPMQYPNPITPPTTAFPTTTTAPTTNTLPRESSQTSSTPPPPMSCASGNVPTMFVPAVPRQNSGSENIGSDATNGTSMASAIQHI